MPIYPKSSIIYSQPMDWIKYLEEQQGKGKIKGYTSIEMKKAPAKSKFSNEKAVVDDLKFDSIKEGKRYKQLKMLLKAGKIAFLSRQVEFELNAGGSHSMAYKADFVYTDQETGERTVEDCKGFLTATYKKKRKLMKKIYGIVILET